jgi:putative protein-disulfide isomerase
MCSWCWGFAPVLDRMQEVYRIPIRIVVGGLRPGPDAEVLDDRLESFLAHHWQQVEAASGQPFDRSFLSRRDGWVYDTELPAAAVVTMRRLAPAAVLPFFQALQRAFYADGVDITDPGTYPPLLEAHDVAADEFVAAMTSENGRKEAWQDFFEARSLGATGFPTLLYQDDARRAVVSRGFAPADRLLPVLSDWLIETQPGAEEGLFCRPGVVC